MKELIIFGKKYKPFGKRRDKIQKELNSIFKETKGGKSNAIIQEFLSNLLYEELAKIYDEIINDSKVDIFGDLDFEIVKSIDKKRSRIAKIKGKKIIVKLNAVSLPRDALKYIVAHEMAHLITKKHGKRFVKILSSFHPNFSKGEKALHNNEVLSKRGSIYAKK
jgi:predicted metal-dependent hydrolase